MPLPRTLKPFLDNLRRLVAAGVEYPDAEWQAAGKYLSDGDVARIRAAYDAGEG